MRPHWLLFPFSFLYGSVIALRNLLFDKGILPVTGIGVPVISIGNITTGGSGKTPVTIETARYLAESGKKIAVVSRGYGRTTTGTVVVSNGREILCTADTGGDEPLLIAMQVPKAVVIVDEDRVRGSLHAVKNFGIDCVILDDGFQHRYLRRTCDIVLFDATRSPFETMLLPAGDRREPFTSLHRAQAVIVTKVRDEATARQMTERKELDHVTHKYFSTYRPVGVRNVATGIAQSLETFKERRVVAVSGIANADGFLRELRTHGAVIVSDFSFGDHHRYKTDEITRIVEQCREHRSDYIVTTEKDAVKLKMFVKELSSVPVLSLTMEVRIERQDEWTKMLQEAVA